MQHVHRFEVDREVVSPVALPSAKGGSRSGSPVQGIIIATPIALACWLAILIPLAR